MKRLTFFLLAVLALLGCSGNRALLIKTNEMPGWILTDWQVFTKQEEIKKELAENYSLYSGYGIKKMIIQELSTSDFKIIRVEMYFLADKTGARGLYRRYQSTFQVPVGDEGSETIGMISFYRNNWFVRVIAFRNLMNKNDLLKPVARQLDQKLTSKR